MGFEMLSTRSTGDEKYLNFIKCEIDSHNIDKDGNLVSVSLNSLESSVHDGETLWWGCTSARMILVTAFAATKIRKAFDTFPAKS